MRPCLAGAAACLLLGVAPVAAMADPIYANDFETAVGPGWSSLSGRALDINRTPVGQGFLGWSGTTGPLNGVSHEQLTLALPVATGGLYRVDFDLYLINSWDGNNTTFGPDLFRFFAGATGAPALQASFANVTGLTQSYPDPYGAGGPAGDHPAKTGARAVNTLGYLLDTVSGDAVYHLSFFAPVHQPDLIFSVQDISNGAGLADESWGLDNVVVSAVPEPRTLALFASGLLALGLIRFGPALSSASRGPAGSSRAGTPD